MEKLLRNKKAIALFLGPGLVLFTLVLFIPILQSIYYSFCDYNALTRTGPFRENRTFPALFRLTSLNMRPSRLST